MVLELLLLAGSGYGNGSGHPPVVPGSPGIRHCSHAALPLFLPGTTPRASGSPWLPHLPAVSLLFINLAFLVNNGTDVAFLWRGSVPDGISQTAYLHDGADSIMLAAFLSALVLLVLFRPEGSVRASKTGIVLGFILAAQTGLLAASVGMRLYFQIKDFGFSPNRVTAGIYLLMGACFLYLLFRYMAGHGNWLRYGKLCGATALVFLALTGLRSPSQLSGDLNLMTMDRAAGLVFQRWRPAAL